LQSKRWGKGEADRCVEDRDEFFWGRGKLKILRKMNSAFRHGIAPMEKWFTFPNMGHILLLTTTELLLSWQNIEMEYLKHFPHCVAVHQETPLHRSFVLVWFSLILCMWSWRKDVCYLQRALSGGNIVLKAINNLCFIKLTIG
jgi:hypothetical protein